jgi:hypothetical protein
MYQYIYMSLNRTEHMHTVRARMHKMFYMKFHARRINIPMSLNGIEYMYIVTTRVKMMFYNASYLDVFSYLYFSKV